MCSCLDTDCDSTFPLFLCTLVERISLNFSITLGSICEPLPRFFNCFTKASHLFLSILVIIGGVL